MRLRPPAGLEAGGIIVLVSLGLYLRFRYAFNGGMWRDEVQFLDIVALPSVPEMLEFLVRHESHPPLYYLMMRWWTNLFPAPEAVLFPGILFGGLTILAGWLAGKTFGGIWAGLSAAALIAFNPGLIRSSAMARPYSFLALLLLFAILLLARGLTRNRRKALAGFVLLGVLLLYSHNWTLLPLVAMGGVAMALSVRREIRIAPGTLLITALAILLAWAPWLPSLAYQTSHAGHLRFPGDPLVAAPYFGLYILPGLSAPATVVLISGLGTILWMRSRYGSRETQGEDRIGAVLTGWTPALAIVLAAMGSYRTRLLVEHSILMLTPLVLVFAALELNRSTLLARPLARVVLVATVLFTMVDAAAMTRTQRSNVDAVARYVGSHARAGDLILVLPPCQLASSFMRYYAGPASVFCYPRGPVQVPLSFSDRVQLDRSQELISGADRPILDGLRRGGTVWEISIGRVDYMMALTDHLELQMVAVAGHPASPVDFGPAQVEEVRLRVWRAPAGSPAVNP